MQLTRSRQEPQALRGLSGHNREQRGGLRVLVLALLLLAVGLLQLGYRLSLPTLGWRVSTPLENDAPVLTNDLLGGPTPLRSGDVLVGFEGQALGTLQRGTAHFAPALTGVRVGEPIRVEVVRGDNRFELKAPLKHWNLWALLGALGSSLRENSLTLLGLAIAVFVFWQRPQHTAAQLMLLYYVGQLLIILSRITELSAGVAVADLLSPVSYYLAVLFTHLLYLVFLAPLILHLCLTFPEPKAFVRRGLLGLVYVLPWVALSLSLLVPSLGRPFLYAFVALYSLVGSAVFVHTFATAEDPLRRAQVRWVAFGFGVASLTGVIWALGALRVLTGPLFSLTLSLPTSLILTVCLALAVLRYGLFDIDLIINRTLVYGTLTTLVVLLYIGVVGGVGALLGTQGNLLLSLVGTGLVAVLFQPLRERLQTFVNRLMYGQRDEPYALLTRLSEQIGAVQAPEAMLPMLAHTVAKTLKLPYVGLFLYPEDETMPSEAVGVCGTATEHLVTFPLEHQGEHFGELRLRAHFGGFGPKELSLFGTVVQQASVAAYTVRQTRALRRSHERLVTAREVERLRLRRDLHDGLGPTLAGLNLQIGALKGRVEEPEVMRFGLAEIQTELRQTAGEVRRIVHDLRPPSLDELGLAGALEQLVASVHTENAQTRIVLELPELPPLQPATEVALYRIVQEGLSNALKHAQATHLSIGLALGETLVLTLSDDGIGFPETYRAGVGLHSMRDRAEALGGRFEVRPSPQGTTIRAEVPFDRESAS